MQTYGNGSAILSGTSVTAPTPEMSVLAAMGGFAEIPTVLAGTLRDASLETHRAARLARFVKTSQEISKPIFEAAPEVAVEASVIEVEAGESVVADLTDAGVLVETGDDIAEVLALIEDANGVWARIRGAESGELLDVHCDLWESEFGTDGENEVLGAWDRSEVARLRGSFLTTV